MPGRAAILICLFVLAGCAAAAPVNVAQMPPGSGLDSPSNAIQYSAWAFASPARTRGDPVSAATAVAAVDYAAGAINVDQSWQAFSPILAAQMLQARQDVRRTLGILPTAPSQEVVDRMLGASFALGHGDRAAALSALNTPNFTLGPERTLALLTDLPFIPIANRATIQAEGALNGTFCALGCARGGSTL